MGRLTSFRTADGKWQMGVSKAAYDASIRNIKKSRGRPPTLSVESEAKVEQLYWAQVTVYERLKTSGAAERELQQNNPTGLWLDKRIKRLGLSPAEWSRDESHHGDGGRKARRYINRFRRKRLGDSRIGLITSELRDEPTSPDEEILEFLNQHLKAINYGDYVYWGPSRQKLLLRSKWNDENRLEISFCKPSPSILSQLIKVKNGYYLALTSSARQAISLINLHISPVLPE